MNYSFVQERCRLGRRQYFTFPNNTWDMKENIINQCSVKAEQNNF